MDKKEAKWMNKTWPCSLIIIIIVLTRFLLLANKALTGAEKGKGIRKEAGYPTPRYDGCCCWSGFTTTSEFFDDSLTRANASKSIIYRVCVVFLVYPPLLTAYQPKRSKGTYIQQEGMQKCSRISLQEYILSHILWLIHAQIYACTYVD